MGEWLFRRAIKLLVLTRASGWWNRQWRYPGRFLQQKREMKDCDVRAHLLGRSWIGSRVPSDGLIDRVVVDIDCKCDEDLSSRNQRYRLLRELFASAAAPLVWSTPSGHGIRVAYRIPATPLTELATGQNEGRLPAVLRAGGLDPALGSVEFYPGYWRCDRQPFGRRMPLLDPETLDLLQGAEIGDTFCEAKLDRAVEIAESWHARDDERFLLELHSLPQYDAPSDAGPAGPEPELPVGHNLLPPADTVRLIKDGLERPHSRYQSEFLIGRAMWLWPELFLDLGLPPQPDREDVAHCLAEWLAERTSGRSVEWQESLRHGLEGAKQWWTEQYLRRNATDGLAPVDRMRRAAVAGRPELWPTVHLTPAERQELLRIGRRAVWSGRLNAGIGLYKFEIWASACLRVAKKQYRRGGESGDRAAATAQIHSEWMRGWPFGGRYVQYKGILENAGFMRVVQEHWRNPVWDLPGRATTYQLNQPEWIRRGDLPMPPDVVEERIAPLRIQDRDVSLDGAYHALHIADSSVDPQRLYGSPMAKRITRYLHVLRPPSPLAGF